MKQFAPAVALLLAACGSEAPPPAAPPAEPTAAPAAAPADPAPAGLSHALLEDDGFTPANPDGTGMGEKLSFGDPPGQVVGRITRLHGGQPPRRSANADCPAGPLSFADWGDDFQVVFYGDRYAGWIAGEDAPRGFATSGGVHIGSTRAQLRAAHPEGTFYEDSPHPAFVLGELRATLSGAGDDATVTRMMAGLDCT